MIADDMILKYDLAHNSSGGSSTAAS
jgi:hypothetical protein